MRKTILVILAMTIAIFTLGQSTSFAAGSSLTMDLRQTPGLTEPLITLYGTVKPAKSGLKITIQVFLDNSWTDTRFSTKSARVGTWKVTATATAFDAVVRYRAKAKVGNKTLYSKVHSIKIKSTPVINEVIPVVDQLGPGGRIHGADISRWQHPNDKVIDFTKMYTAGIRFVMIKASDSRDDSDAITLKYLMMDRSAAQAAGIYTGFYHYAVLPNSKDKDVIIQDAQTQAQKVIWRLASIGGYTEKDLPYALDLENNCVEISGGSCKKYASKQAITLWAKTFLAIVKEKTRRTPIIYSYPAFLENATVRDDELRSYPLWLAQYAINPFDPLNQPGLKEGGCYVHSWTTSDCSSVWTFWQYTSCGIADKYGVPGTRVDLNVFRGDASKFLALSQGTWIPEPADQMPKNEISAMVIKSTKYSTADKPVVVEADVFRPDGKPVVTGTIRFYPNPLTPINPKPVQTVVRATSGSWKLSVKGIPAGLWTGEIGFIDATGTHAEVRVPIEIMMQEAVSTSPSPSPTPKTSPSPKRPSDGCAKQIKN